MSVVMIIMGILIPILIIYIVYLFYKNKKRLDDEKLFREEFKNLVDNSFDCIRLLDDAIQRICTYKWHNFTDSKIMENINKSHVKKLVGEVVTEVKNAFSDNWELMSLYVLYDYDFLYKYITNATALYLKELLNAYVKNEL